MYSKEIMKQLRDLNKNIFDNAFKTMTFFIDQTENNFFRLLEKSPFVSDEGKKIINEWGETYKKNREYFKAYANENYKKITDYFAQLETEETKKSDKK